MSCYDVLEVWCGFVCLENVVVAWFEFKFCILTFQQNSRAFWLIHINEFHIFVPMEI